MPRIRYEWKSDYRGTAVDPNVVAREVRKIERKHGECPPGALVDAARPVGSPIHSLFEWDDTQAAEAWRKQQARVVINHLRVRRLETDAQVPAFVHISRADQREGYVSTNAAMSDPELRAGVLRDAVRTLEGFRNRYAALSELSPVWDALDQVRESDDGSSLPKAA